jgi:hypothetical protein
MKPGSFEEGVRKGNMASMNGVERKGKSYHIGQVNVKWYKMILFFLKKIGNGEFFINTRGTNGHFTTVHDRIQNRQLKVTRPSSLPLS